MGRKEDNIKRATEVMHNRERIRNLAIAAHIDHGKTTLSDNLIAGAGMMSEELAGKSRVLDFDDQESARGITINAASASMVHGVDGEDYLINLIDTPGHVDFGGDVTRAMRAVDGCIILTCAVEGQCRKRDRGPAGSEGESSPSPIHQQGRQTNQRTTGNPRGYDG